MRGRVYGTLAAPFCPRFLVSLGAAVEEVSVTLDGEPASSALIDERRPVNPGRHEVIGRRGDEVVSVAVVKDGRAGDRVLAMSKRADIGLAGVD